MTRLIAGPSLKLQYFRGVPLATLFENNEVQGIWNIDGRMPVLLLAAAWPRLRRQFAGAVWLAEPPKRPSLCPWLGRFLFGYLLRN